MTFVLCGVLKNLSVEVRLAIPGIIEVRRVGAVDDPISEVCPKMVNI
jgi:hypothetical protein